MFLKKLVSNMYRSHHIHLISKFCLCILYTAEKSLEKCMQDYGGKRTVQGYKSNTCDDCCDYNNWPLHRQLLLQQANRPESFTVVLFCILDYSISFIPVDNFQVTAISNLGVQCR